MEAKGPRLAIIGLDGVPYELIRDLAAKGVMPMVDELFQEGKLDKMASSVPAVSSVAWSSIITGENPGTHGIFGFTDVAAGSYRLTFPNFAQLKAPPFWEESLFGRSAILNVPSTYPARPMNGVHIAGFVAPDLTKAVYPPSLVDQLRAWEYEVDVDASSAHQSLELFLRKLNQTLDARTRAFLGLVERPWDTFMAVYTGTDRLLHFLWPAVTDPRHRLHEAALDYFRRVDHSIGRLVERLPEEAPLVMLSDHGFEALEIQVNINRFLLQEGFLRWRRERPRSLNDLAEGSVAFALDPARIYLHRKGRYPRGTVGEDQAEKLVDQLAAALAELRVEGREAVARVYRRQEIYHGPQVDRAPDLVAIPAPGIEFKAGLEADSLAEPAAPFTGKHRGDNAFLYVRPPEGHEQPPQARSVQDVQPLLVWLKNSLCQSRRRNDE